MFSLAYHQSRWNYNDEQDVEKYVVVLCKHQSIFVVIKATSKDKINNVVDADAFFSLHFRFYQM